MLSRKLNDTSYAFWLDKLQQHKTAIREFRDAIFDQARAKTDAAKSLSQQVGQKLQQLEQTVKQIHEVNTQSSTALMGAESGVEAVKRKASEIERIYSEMRDSQLPTLDDQKDALSDSVTQNDNKMPGLKIRDADRHVYSLENTARGMDRHFLTDAFSNDVLSASNAYRDIENAMKNASNAAVAAKSVGHTAL